MRITHKFVYKYFASLRMNLLNIYVKIIRSSFSIQLVGTEQGRRAYEVAGQRPLALRHYVRTPVTADSFRSDSIKDVEGE
jgi:hypothetical protein